MARPVSFRLDEDLLARLEAEAGERQMSVTGLVSALLDEGLKTRQFPGITYRDGPTGRRAGVLGGPDVWEIVAEVQRTRATGQRRVRRVADTLRLPITQVRLAIDFYAGHPEEIDERISASERAAERLRESIARREHLLSG
jgi:hypothetical protein